LVSSTLKSRSAQTAPSTPHSCNTSDAVMYVEGCAATAASLVARCASKAANAPLNPDEACAAAIVSSHDSRFVRFALGSAALVAAAAASSQRGLLEFGAGSVSSTRLEFA
jgi:hypothetical protein